VASNPFDQFDAVSESSGNPFDQFDDKPAPEKSSIARRVGDYGISALKGAIAVPETAVGLADIVTGGRAGKAAESVGFRPREAKEILDTYLSPEQQAANKAVSDAKGFLPTIGAAVKNPSTIAQTVVESVPSMLGGGVIARGVSKLLPKVAPVIAGAIGEGAVGAGSASENVRQQTDDGLLGVKEIAPVVASGVGTAAFGAAGGRIAQKLGIADVDTLLAQGGAGVTQKGIARRIVEGGISEGVFEELPQSVQEQIWQNVALDKPLLEGVPESGALGLLAGGVMGGVASGAFTNKQGQTQPAVQTAEQAQPEQPALGLPNYPNEPLISFPDGSAGTQSQAEEYINGLPEDQRIQARAALYGYAPEAAAKIQEEVNKNPTLLLPNARNETLVGFPDGSIGTRAQAEEYINGLPESERMAKRAALLGYTPQPASPAGPLARAAQKVIPTAPIIPAGADNATIENAAAGLATGAGGPGADLGTGSDGNSLLLPGDAVVQGLGANAETLASGGERDLPAGTAAEQPADSVAPVGAAGPVVAQTETSNPVVSQIAPNIDNKTEPQRQPVAAKSTTNATLPAESLAPAAGSNTSPELRPIVESIAKRRAVAEGQLGKNKAYGRVLAAAKDMMNGQPIKLGRLRIDVNELKGDKELHAAGKRLIEIASAPAKEATETRAQTAESYRKRIDDAKTKDELNALASEIQKDESLTDQQAQDLDDAVFERVDQFPEPTKKPAVSQPKPEPLYASRQVENAEEIIAWAKSQGFKTTLPAKDMHVTVAYSKTPMDGSKVGSADTLIKVDGGKRSVEKIGDEGAVVLKFTSDEMQARWKQYRDSGASWDYEQYTPHITLTYDGTGIDLDAVEPYAGTISLGAEKQEPLNENKADEYKEEPTAPAIDEAKKAKQEKAAVASEPESKIEDLGEKIGGARKDTATKGGTKAAKTKAGDERPTWAKRYEINQIAAAMDDNIVGKWAIYDSRDKNRFGMPRQMGGSNNFYDTREAAEAELPELAVSQKHKVYATAQRSDGTYGYEIYRNVTDRKRVKIVDRVFGSRVEALEYMGKNAADILETNTTFGEIDLPTPDNVNRIGVERRAGDVADTDFIGTFGFRGVEFGNWNNQIERQQFMNAAYDGLLDLADVLNLPPKAISLNGDLALAFGARGQGLTSAKAHYEREKSVINLTKENGAGSLAHEFFHAMDHYFGRQDGKASAEWKMDADGTRSFTAGKTPDSDYVSAGFSYKSNVRPELKEAYKKLMETIFRKAATYVEDTQQADKFVAAAKDRLAESLDKLRAELSQQKDPKYWKRKNAPASAEQLAEFDTIAEQLLNGQGLDADYRDVGGKSRSRFGNMRRTNDALEKLSALHKDVRGRSGFDSTNQSGVMDGLRQTMANYSMRLKTLSDAQAGQEKVKTVPTDFLMNARELDEGRGKDYWTTPHEMAARAFQGYVEDKIAEKGGRSPFMNYGREGAGILTPWGVKFPFPRGDERKAINAALDGFVKEIQTKETDKGVALFSRGTGTGIPIAKAQSLADDLAKKFPNLPAAIVVQSQSEIPPVQRDIEQAKDEFLQTGTEASYSKWANLAKDNIEGAYVDGKFYLVAGNIRGESRLREVFVHEGIGHLSVESMLDEVDPRMMPKLVNQVRMLDAGGNKYIRQLAKEVDKRQPGLDKVTRAKEIIAFIAERGDQDVEMTSAVRSLWQRIVDGIKAFAKLVFDVNLTDRDVRDIVAMAARYAKGEDVVSLYAAGESVMFSRANRKPSKDAGDTFVSAAMEYLARDPELFQRPSTEVKDIYGIAKEIDPGYRVEKLGPSMTKERGAERAWEIFVPGSDVRSGIIMTNYEEVWIDVSRLQSGVDSGSAIYDMAATYAHNNGKVLIGDPLGLSRMAYYRRNENMLSSALKYGTTRHLRPALEQEMPAEKFIGHEKAFGESVRPLKWIEGDDVNNIREMIYNSWQAAIDNVPELKDVIYDPATQQFQYTDGRPFTDQDSERIAAELARPGNPYRAGSATQKRAALFNTFLRESGREGRKQVLGALVDQLSRGGLSPALQGILYSRSAADAGIPSAEPQSEPASKYAELNRKFREEHITLLDKSKKWLKRQLAPGGLLPKSVFDEKIRRDSEFEVIEFDVKHLVGQLERAIQKDFKLSPGELDTKTQELLSDVMAGKIGDVPESTKVALLGMRQYIDQLSTQYIDGLAEQGKMLMQEAERTGDAKAIAEAQERFDLMQVIMGNVGQYVHRSYRAFDDPDWARAVPDATLDAARDYLIQRNLETMTPATAAARAEIVLNEILKNGTAYDNMEAFIRESKLGAKDLSVLKTRKQIAPQIRALLGEYTDPRINFAKSATKMGRLIWNQKFLEKVLDVGMGNFLFTDDTKPPEATAKIAADKSEVYSPLNGLWTFPETDQAFKDALGKEQMADWYRKVVQINGAVKYGKTVLSPTTAARNWMSAFFFSVANGHFDLRHMKKSVDGLKEYFTHGGDAAKLAYLRELKQLGVVYDTPYAGEMMRLLSDSNLSDKLLMSKGKLKMKNALDLATKGYQFGDDFWKIIGFENEKRMWMDTGMPEQQAKEKAAERIRNTYPTYSMVGKGIQSLRRFPLAGTFVSFPAEIIRTSINMVRYLAEDYKDPVTRPLAMRRAAGMAIASSFAYAAQALSMAALGYDDDDEEAVRQMAAPWQRNSNLLFTGRDGNGNIRFLDMSFLDPYNYWKRPIVAVTRGQPFDDALRDVASEILTPFFGVDILAGTIFEVLANKKESGAPVYQGHDDAINQLTDIANHMRKTVQPGIVSNMERTYKALDGEVSFSGKKYDINDEAAAWVGFRVSTLDPKVALYYRSFDFKDAKAEADKSLRDAIRNPKGVDSEDLRDAYDMTNRLRERAYQQMSQLVQAGQRSGMTNQQVFQTLKNSGISNQDIFYIRTGMTPRYKVNPQSMREQIMKARGTFGPEVAQEIRKRYAEVAGYQ
jgi:hypothetical protein